ncbi:hypothetical protein [Longirhabdus pacifica]|uniref:hypothetical protein n=1 Tax=Longirhabdus pacifica TaxID=2305227 RepID=UPI0010090B9E|nr:hypothetical protein [Longirhabdus pacifica]
MKKLLNIAVISALSLNLSLASAATAATTVPTAPIAPTSNTVISNETMNMPAFILQEDGEVVFKEVWELPFEQIVPAALMSKKFEAAINPQSLELDFASAIDIVKQDSNMALIGTVNQTITEQEANVEVMVNRLVDLLSSVLGIALSGDTLEAYAEAMRATFLNLPEENTNYLIWKSSNASNVSYQYNIFFAVEKNGILFGMPVGLTISADTSKYEILGLTAFDQHNYSVNVKAIKVMNFDF